MMKCVHAAGVSHSVHGMKRVLEGHSALGVPNAFAAEVNLGLCAACVKVLYLMKLKDH